MDDESVSEAKAFLATLIGMILEDHVDVALSAGQGAGDDWPSDLRQAGEDVAALAAAIAVIARRCKIDPQAA